MNRQIFSSTKSVTNFQFAVAIILLVTIVTAEGFYLDDNAFKEKCRLSVKCTGKAGLEVHVINESNPSQPMRFYHDLNCSGKWYHYTWMVAEGNGTIYIEEHQNNISKTIKIFNHVATDRIIVKIKTDRKQVFFRSDLMPPCFVIWDTNHTKHDEDFNRSSSKETLPPRMLFLVIWILVNFAVNNF